MKSEYENDMQLSLNVARIKGREELVIKFVRRDV